MLNLNYHPTAVIDTDGMPESDWLKWRTTGIGGSDVAAIFEISGWTTKRALYYSKIGLDKGEPDNPYTLDFGHWVEPFVAAWFEKRFDKYKKWLEEKLSCKIASMQLYKDTWMYQHPLFPFMQANLDYRIRVTTTSGEVREGIFECKTTTYNIFDDKWGYNKVPYEYELQCRHYMAVTNTDFTLIACLCGNNENDYCVRFIERDIEMEEELIEMEADFWENNVIARVAPALSVEHAEQEEEAFVSYDIASRIKKGDLKEVIAPAPELLAAVKAYMESHETKKALDAAVKKASGELTAQKVKLLEAMAGENEVAYKEGKDDYYVVKNNVFSQRRVDSDRLKMERPDIYGEFAKESTSGRFTIVKRTAKK